jgi:hypothetical protein
MNNITNLEEELQKDLAELEGNVAKKKTVKKKAIKKTTRKKVTKKAAAPVEPALVVTTSPEPAMVEPEEQDDKGAKIVFFTGIALIIMLFLGLYFGSNYFYPTDSAETIEYKGTTFTFDHTHWVFPWQQGQTTYQIPLRFNPLQVENVTIKGALDPKFNKQSPIYISYDPVADKDNLPTLTVGTGEIMFNLIQALGKDSQVACAVDDGSTGCNQAPIASCDDKDKSVIFLKTQGEPGIYIQGTCIVITGQGEELLRGIDRLLYNWYGIMR